jgi:hypothetical protein
LAALVFLFLICCASSVEPRNRDLEVYYSSHKSTPGCFNSPQTTRNHLIWNNGLVFGLAFFKLFPNRSPSDSEPLSESDCNVEAALDLALALDTVDLAGAPCSELRVL